MRIKLGMGQVLGQIILLYIYNILHIGTMILNLICVAIDFGFRISWFWYRYWRQLHFRFNLVTYWVLYSIFRLLYGKTSP